MSKPQVSPRLLSRGHWHRDDCLFRHISQIVEHFTEQKIIYKHIRKSSWLKARLSKTRAFNRLMNDAIIIMIITPVIQERQLKIFTAAASYEKQQEHHVINNGKKKNPEMMHLNSGIFGHFARKATVRKYFILKVYCLWII